MDPPKGTAAGLDKVIHQPVRTGIMAILASADEADFLYLKRRLGVTDGNLNSHLTTLEKAGYVTVQKAFVGRRPRTSCRLTRAGRQAFERYVTRLEGLLGDSTTTERRR